MEPERWKQIQALYDSAIALPPEKRAEFLAQACPADAGLRSESEGEEPNRRVVVYPAE